MKEELRNLVSKAELKKRLAAEAVPRTTVSFYRYCEIENPGLLRDEIYRSFERLDVFGRVYLATEGVNAQISVPTANFEQFKNYLYSYDFLNGVRLNVAVEDDGKSFYVLNVKARKKIVADGIEDPSFSMRRRGEYLNAEEFNRLAENPETVVVDIRNYYEYEVGHFENAIEIPSDTFREQLPTAAEMLADKKHAPVVMYCTGGIRCEKASAYFLHRGFTKVFHLEGGIIEYARQVRQKGLENKFRGKNFVFDERLGERVSDEIISHCHQCGARCDTHRNCENAACHLLFIQCGACLEKFEGACSAECLKIKNLPPQEQKKLRREPDGKPHPFSNSQKLSRARFFDLKEKP